MLDKIRNDHSLGLDSLYNNPKVIHPETSFRIVAPFIEHALNPPKPPKKNADDIYDKSSAVRKRDPPANKYKTLDPSQATILTSGKRQIEAPSIMASAHFQGSSNAAESQEEEQIQ